MGLFDLFKKKQEQPESSPVVAPTQGPKEKGENVKNFKVAGTSFHTKDIMKLAVKNDSYSLTKKGIIDAGLVGKDIYQYEFPVSVVELIPEPGNEVDPNAVKVVADGILIGYIKKGNCSQVKKLLEGDKIDHLELWIGGGKYKFVSDTSGYGDKPDYEMESDEKEIGAKVTVYLKT